MAEIQCDCGKFKAHLLNFESSTPGRIVCYCNDCQNYLNKLKRQDLLDPYGGIELIPVYPNDFKIIEGSEYLKCNKLTAKGLNRWSVTCCNSPVANTMAKFPWVGIPYKLFQNISLDSLDKIGPIKSRIKGKYKTSDAPFAISDDLSFKDALVVLPFVLKGFFFRKYKTSPFFETDGVTPVKKAEVLS